MRFGTTRRKFIFGSASAAALAAVKSPAAFAADKGQPESLLRDADEVIDFRNWGSNPPEIIGAHRFLDLHPDVAVQWNNVSFAKYRDALTAEFVGGSKLDSMTIPETELSGWADAGFLAPVDEMPGYEAVAANAVPAAIEAGKGLDGRAYGIPYTMDPFGYVYNRRMLNDAGFGSPPKNLDEIRAQMQAIKKAGINEFPLHLGLKQAPGQMWSIWCFVFGSGGRMFDEENQPLFDGKDDTLSNVLEWYVAAINDWKIVGPDDFGKNWGDGRNDIKQGHVAGGCLARWALRFANVDADSSVRGEVFLGKMPGLERDDVSTVGAFHQIGIAANAQLPEPAWQFIHHISGPEASGSYQTHRERSIAFGGRAAYLPALEHADYVEMVKETNNGETENYNTISEMVRQKEAVKTYWYPEWEAFWMQQVQDALTKKVSVKDALSASAERARRLAKE
ncbi:extracellular solute-binding protein [Nitratireductor sp. XY-223]|uniref:ABC transporter substrate-binding protein n=1 Tax=Nitratireductor sp. XY-223 TaxID=2561926 RepID=UPI0010A9A3A9|nr:extracellular solute-binding protein [Nitratireductor sp. XY-223]